MRTILTVVVTVVIAGLLGYVLVPMLIEREVAPLKTDIAQLQSRLQVSEEFIKAEEELRQKTDLRADTRLPDVVKTVNRLAAGQKSLEDMMQVRFADFDAKLTEIKAATGGGMNKLSQQIEEGTKNTERRFQEGALRARVEDARIRLVKVKSELAARNFGVAKGELDLLGQSLDDAKKLVADNDGRKTMLEKIQGMVKEIRVEMDGNPVAASDRIDLLWHELAKLSVSG